MEESQRKAVCWMWYNLFDACRGGVLADSMGNNLVQVTQFINGLCLPRLIFKCLLIVPTQSVDLWASAFLQLAPRVRVAEFVGKERNRRLDQVLSLGGVVICSYGVAMTDLVPRMGANDEETFNEANIWDVIIFSDAERLKDSTSKTNAALSRLQGNVNLLLTSHPVAGHPKDLYALFDFACEADAFGSYDLFRDRFEVPIARSTHKRADEMDRQLASVARIQMMDLIDSQYWQNWQVLFTPGGSKREDVMPAFVATPTPFKDRTNSYLSSHDVSSTPSFSKTKSVITTAKKTQKITTVSTPTSTHKKTTTKRKSNKNKSLFPEVINLDEDDGESPMGIDDLEKSIASLSFDLVSTPSTKLSSTSRGKRIAGEELLSTPTQAHSSSSLSPIDLTAEPKPRPTRRTPIRNALYSAMSPQKTPVRSATSSEEVLNTPVNSIFGSSVPGTPVTPEAIQARQRASFGRISLLDEGESDDIDLDEEMPGSSLASRGAPTPAKDAQKKPSLSTKVWPSTAAFLRQRDCFAIDLFQELNKTIFNGQLPRLPLVWTKMPSCAGKYYYKDSTIQLSATLLTNAQRLTSTLAHEMAHAAAHLIDHDLEAKHGPVWQKWARIGRARYPSVITGTIYHDYCN